MTTATCTAKALHDADWTESDRKPPISRPNTVIPSARVKFISDIMSIRATQREDINTTNIQLQKLENIGRRFGKFLSLAVLIKGQCCNFKMIHVYSARTYNN
jgi:hypothetical protein